MVYNAGVADADFRPEMLSRRGELIAWGSTLLVGGAWLSLQLLGQPITRAVPVLAVLLLLAALSISLGNWMDRQTVMRLDDEGISFRNGLRNTRLGWDEITRLRVLPSQWGKKVEVIGEHAHFEFRTLGEVKVQGEVKGRMGFADGEQILRRILDATHLKRMPGADPGRLQQSNSYYYVRE